MKLTRQQESIIVNNILDKVRPKKKDTLEKEITTELNKTLAKVDKFTTRFILLFNVVKSWGGKGVAGIRVCMNDAFWKDWKKVTGLDTVPEKSGYYTFESYKDFDDEIKSRVKRELYTKLLKNNAYCSDVNAYLCAQYARLSNEITNDVILSGLSSKDVNLLIDTLAKKYA